LRTVAGTAAAAAAAHSPSSSRVISNFSSRAIMISTCTANARREGKEKEMIRHWSMSD
jgi:hypothetical protein